ncbi:MAG: sulfatase [Bacteroidales bacterium]|nr:sulfatase [Bacteroidales bacterium]
MMNHFNKFLIAGELLAVSVVFSSCEQVKEVQAPNIIWITSEDNSSNFLQLYDEKGVPAPNIEFLAENGIVYTHAFSNAPVCSVARSTLISSRYAPGIGAHYHRKIQQVPMPEGLRMFPAYLRDAGYYTTNNAKEDYNIIKADNVWDESSNKASWRNREENQPFFHVQNIGVTHESRLHFTAEQMQKQQNTTDSDSVFIPPYHPQNELFKYTYARYYDRNMEMDQQVGKIVNQLKEDGLLDNTFIFYFGDHGGVLPGSKGYLKEQGLKVPLVIYVPEKYKAIAHNSRGTEVDAFVSFVDFGATVLNLAGIEVPEEMDGNPFLGKGIKSKELKKRDETFSYADRFDEKYDLVRALRKGNYKYIRNYQAFNIDALQNDYRYIMLAYENWRELFKKGELDNNQSSFFRTKNPEELYDLENDPYELNNLAKDPQYAEVLNSMRNSLKEKIMDVSDLGFYPEHYFLDNAVMNPSGFGMERKDEIEKLIAIADLALLEFDDAKEGIEKSLQSDNHLERYWGLIVCSTFGEEARDFIPDIKVMTLNDQEPINRVRAAEYLALIEEEDPTVVINEALAKSTKLAESLLILNTATLLKDINSPYPLRISAELIPENLMGENYIERRVNYINNNDSE